MKKIVSIITVGIIAILAIGACAPAGAAQPEGEEKINITVSIVPEKYFVERIGGDKVNVNVMVGPGESPHSYEPKPEQMKLLSNSVLYFAIGVEFDEVWKDKLVSTNPDMKWIDLSESLEKMPIAEHHHHDEEGEAHEEEEDHDHEGESLDPHVWTSPKNAKIMAEQIFDELVLLDSANKTFYEKNLADFNSDVDTLISDINETLEKLESGKFLVFHPAWGYFARDFGLEQIPIEVDGSEPSSKELAAILEEAEEEEIRVVFASPTFSTKTAEYIAEQIDGQVVLISPLAADWLSNLRSVAEKFGELL